MKINLCVLPLVLLVASSLQAVPLTKAMAVHLKPDAASPTVATLGTGTEPMVASGVATPAPAGWTAVELPGPHEAYVQNKDLSKNLDVRLGTQIHVAPKADSAVLAVMEKGDSAEISGRVQGRWQQIRLQKKVIGYINVASVGSIAPTPTAVSSSTPTSASATTASASPTPAASTPPPAPPSPAPIAPSAHTGSGQAVAINGTVDAGSAALPRLFPGKFASTRKLLTPRRPYDFQLSDSNGDRYAYLDVTKLLQTEQLDKFIDHNVLVYGVAKPVPNSKEMVIEVETLQLR